MIGGMDMKKFMTGNEAVARGLYEAGVTFASAYPGTPSTEILENVALYKDSLYCEWAPNEKVALESAFGASVAGARAVAAMKHVGVNVAADPMFTFGYTGVNGGMILISADDPGCHSSQNEQDNRYYAKFAHLVCIEPSDSQEAKDFIKTAYEISEEFDTAILYRLTTRVCHSKSLVEEGERIGSPYKEYVKNMEKYVAAPANARRLHPIVVERFKKLAEYSETTHLNRIEWHDKKIGVITSGVAYQYAKEVFEDRASYLKIGMSYPLPMKKIRDFAEQVDTLYVIEELEPFIEEHLKIEGIKCIGKEKIPRIGELNPDIIAKALLGEESDKATMSEDKIVARPPTLCAGCPHRGFFYELAKKKKVMVTGDIGCYTLGCAPPLSTIDTVIDMGASISMGHGAAQAFKQNGVNTQVISVIGDSTFFHTGINSLINVVYNKSNCVVVILDNRITGMTGHQENPGSGYTLMGEKTNEIDITGLVKAIGIKDVRTINPLDLKASKQAIEDAMAFDGPSVVITRWPCVLKRFTQEDKQEFELQRPKCKVDTEACRGCKMCIKTGCPAISFNKETKKALIDRNMCVGCTVCMQSCPFEAIKKEGK